MQPLSGMLVVDFSRYLPGAFASRELLELGARVVCIEPPGGDPMRSSAPAWDAALRAGKESLEVDLKRSRAGARARRGRPTSCSSRSAPASRRGSASVPSTSGTHRLLLDHRLRPRRPPRAARRARPQLPRLGRRALGHSAGVAAGPDRRFRGGRARRRDEDPRGAAGARAHRQGRPRRRLDDPRLASPRRAPARRRDRPAHADRRPGLLPHLRDRGRPPGSRSPRSSPPSSAAWPSCSAGRSWPSASSTPTRRRSRPSSRRSSRPARSPNGWSSSTPKTSASGRSRRSPRRRPTSGSVFGPC